MIISILLEKEWIVALPSDVNSRKKQYEVTALGKKIAKNEILRLKELLLNGEKIIGRG